MVIITISPPRTTPQFLLAPEDASSIPVYQSSGKTRTSRVSSLLTRVDWIDSNHGSETSSDILTTLARHADFRTGGNRVDAAAVF